MGPTLVWYLLGIGATTVATEGAAGGTTTEARGGEDQRTRGRKALPPRVFTILEPEKEKKGGGGLQKQEMGCEMKRKERKRALNRGGGANEKWKMKGQGR